nr:uncharacterized protein LOC112032105 [Quercus suber]
MKRVMVDQSNDAEIMYPDLYKGLNLRSKDLIAYDSPLVSFDGKVVIPRGQIKLPVEAGSEVVEVDFIVVDAYSPYTAIMARHWLYALGAVSSTLHQKIEAQLPLLEKEELIEFLRKNVDVFTWSAYETPRVDPSFMYHHLNVNPSVTPKKQPPQRSSKDYFDTVRDKVMKLKQAGAIKEVFYPEWLANTVVAKKKSDKFLGNMVTHQGIEVNPTQIKAINSLQSPQNLKEVQKLTRMIAALNQFISQSADRCGPFFLLMNKWNGFEWTEECVLAFWQA